jgi:hypothetical protein
VIAASAKTATAISEQGRFCNKLYWIGNDQLHGDGAFISLVPGCRRLADSWM